MNTRRAFTLVELLVVIAIIGVLVALLLPAVQAARESARRMQCQNNLKQIGLALNGYHDTYRQFPWGGRNGPSNCCNADKREHWNWTYYILPYMEQQTIFDTTSDAAVYATPISVYYCPTRRKAQTYKGTSRGDYAGNSGKEAPGSNSDDGIFVQSNREFVSIPKIRDGTSNTILVGEKHLHKSHLGGTSVYFTDNEPVVNVGWESDLFRRGKDTPIPDKSQDSGFTLRFGSSHNGGINVVLVDGSVHFITWQVDPTNFLSLCQRADGKPVKID